MTAFSIMRVVAGWGVALAMSCLSAGAVARQQPAGAPRFEIAKAHGLVKQIKVHLADQGKVLVLDRFTDIEVFVEREKQEFSKPARLDPVCKKLPGSRVCEQTCYWAGKARPFARARLLNAAGQVQWRWQAGEEDTLSRLLPSSTDKVADGACLSPDGKYLTTLIYGPRVSDEPLGAEVLNVAARFKGVDAIGAKTKKPFGDKRGTYFVRWQAGRPHTLVFMVLPAEPPYNEEDEVLDHAVLR
jgi:hypothetical protein